MLRASTKWIKLFNLNHCKKELIFFMGGYPDSNRELTVPHTVALPIELYLPCSIPAGIASVN